MTRVKVIVTTKAAPRIEVIDDHTLRVSVREKPEHGEANAAVRKALAKFYRTTQQCVSLVMGAQTKNKIFEIRQ